MKGRPGRYPKYVRVEANPDSVRLSLERNRRVKRQIRGVVRVQTYMTRMERIEIELHCATLAS
jgi:hypothetical protein